MKRIKQVLTAASEKLDLPPEVIAGLPQIEVTGTIRVSIDGHKGLKEYSDQRIVVNSSIGEITVIGLSLHLQGMTKDTVTVGGKIISVSVGSGDLG